MGLLSDNCWLCWCDGEWLWCTGLDGCYSDLLGLVWDTLCAVGEDVVRLHAINQLCKVNRCEVLFSPSAGFSSDELGAGSLDVNALCSGLQV